MPDARDVETWLREQCAGYDFALRGALRRGAADVEWPLHATDVHSLEEELVRRGLLAPLPAEPAALANVVETSILDFVLERLDEVPGAAGQRGKERGYPDLEISGDAFGGGIYAVDVKVAKLREYKRPTSDPHTQSAITLYTGNTYFKHPDLHFDGALRRFGEYAGHLDIIVIYRFVADSRARIADVEVIVQRPWRIASRLRSSKTREYIGAVKSVAALREGRGAFESEAEFYDYWRRYNFNESTQVRKQYQRELARLREERGGSGA